ncbi:hypothetical protein FGB62_45g148 [Gracilaria domingensis]|nr:hypothetical protein FGB62_45g148 [Gracilaria domingensis]
MPAFAAPSPVASPLRAAYFPRAASRARARPLRSPAPAVRRARMSAPSPPSPEEDASAEDASNNPPSPPLNLEVLRRRISDLDARQKAGHAPTDTVSGSVKEVPGASFEYRRVNRALEPQDDDDDDAEVLQLISDFESLRNVWVIVFTNRVDSSEGIYINVGDENIVLAFQDKEEAQRYSLCLEQQQFPMPKVAELETGELAEFCSESGFRLGFVPKGSLITPPEQSAVDDLDKWRSDSSSSSKSSDLGMTSEEIDTMRKRFDTLFGL